MLQAIVKNHQRRTENRVHVVYCTRDDQQFYPPTVKAGVALGH